MATVRETKTIDTDPLAMWRIISDMMRYAEWMVLPAGKITKVTVIKDAGVLTGSAIANGSAIG